jgi:hypothetical protein
MEASERWSAWPPLSRPREARDSLRRIRPVLVRASVRPGSPETAASTGSSSVPVDRPRPGGPLSCMERDSGSVTAAFLGYRSAVGSIAHRRTPGPRPSRSLLPRLVWPSWRRMMIRGTLSRASSSTGRGAAGAARTGACFPLRAARRRDSVRTAAPDHARPRVGTSIMQNMAERAAAWADLLSAGRRR